MVVADIQYEGDLESLDTCLDEGSRRQVHAYTTTYILS